MSELKDWFCSLCPVVIEYRTPKDLGHYKNEHLKKDHNATFLPYKCKDKNCGCKNGDSK